jgi:hypothetical protein
MERCAQMQQKLDIAIAMKPPGSNSASIHLLRKQAIHLCTHNKEAQGARTFAKALALYGLEPTAQEENPPCEPVEEGSQQ